MSNTWQCLWVWWQRNKGTMTGETIAYEQQSWGLPSLFMFMCDTVMIVTCYTRWPVTGVLQVSWNTWPLGQVITRVTTDCTRLSDTCRWPRVSCIIFDYNNYVIMLHQYIIRLSLYTFTFFVHSYNIPGHWHPTLPDTSLLLFTFLQFAFFTFKFLPC